jgi:RNA polymerase primary sigma factor
MATKIKIAPRTEGTLEKKDRQSPLLDLPDAAVRELLRTAKKCDYVEYDQINALLGTEEVSSEQIENIMAKFSEMGINVVGAKEARREKEVAAGEELEYDEAKWKARTS